MSEDTLQARLRVALGGRSIAVVARTAKLSRNHVHRLLREGAGKLGPSWAPLTALAAACEVSPSWLADGRGERHAQG